MPTDTTTPPPTPPHTEQPGRGFFDWMRGLGIVRQPGWIGGVCAGVAARLNIDVIIVRGIVVVLAIFGGPALLLYAAAWLLLPDNDDNIHLERLIRGQFEPAVIGVGVLFLLALLPLGG
ncbi:MAG TPA: PspC domain-containing protein, partial [Terrimesophilobacter sp.]|nr:PspC domain-containing protein [Terrimesophilobacter sp.]